MANCDRGFPPSSPLRCEGLTDGPPQLASPRAGVSGYLNSSALDCVIFTISDLVRARRRPPMGLRLVPRYPSTTRAAAPAHITMAAEPPGSGACWDGVVRLIVVGDAGSGKSAVIESFSAHLRGEPPPPRRASLEAARPVEGRDAFAPCAPGDVGFDALGRRVCLLEIPGALAAPAGGDAFLALTEMPRDQGRTRVIQRRFNVSVPRARVLEKASTLRDRSER